MTITMKADPYTIVIIPGIRGPDGYVAGGFRISVGQLSVVDYAEVMRTFVSGAWNAAAAQSSPVTYELAPSQTSNNVVVIRAFDTSGEVVAGRSLSHIPFAIRAYGH